MLQLDDLNQNAVSCQEKSEKKGNTRNTFVKKNYAVKQSFQCVSFRKNCGCCQTYDQNRFRHKELPELGQRSQDSWSPGRRRSLDEGLAFRIPSEVGLVFLGFQGILESVRVNFGLLSLLGRFMTRVLVQCNHGYKNRIKSVG